MLSEYLEIIVPGMYATFVFVMIRLPSAPYHTELDGVSSDNVDGIVEKMLLYTLLEFTSFVVLAQVMRRNCGINALYQLAFVMETQMAFVLSKLLLWMMVTLTYRVEHFGTI